MEGLVWDSEALEGKCDDEPWPLYRTHAGISLACTIDLATGLPTFYGAMDGEGHDVVALAHRLEAAPLVVSFNGKGYDNVVLGSVLGRPFKPPNEIDLYDRIKTALRGEQWGKGSWTLDRIARDTLGVGKTSQDGAFAPTLWARREMGRLVTYLYRDAWLTWKLWEFGRVEGYVRDPCGGKLEVGW